MIRAAPSKAVPSSSLDEQREHSCLLISVGGISLWKNDNNVCRNIHSLARYRFIFVFMARGCFYSAVAKSSLNNIFAVLGKCSQMSNRRSLAVSKCFPKCPVHTVQIHRFSFFLSFQNLCLNSFLHYWFPVSLVMFS